MKRIPFILVLVCFLLKSVYATASVFLFTIQQPDNYSERKELVYKQAGSDFENPQIPIDLKDKEEKEEIEEEKEEEGNKREYNSHISNYYSYISHSAIASHLIVGLFIKSPYYLIKTGFPKLLVKIHLYLI